jgi:hypothetical protein
MDHLMIEITSHQTTLSFLLAGLIFLSIFAPISLDALAKRLREKEQSSLAQQDQENL